MAAPLVEILAPETCPDMRDLPLVLIRRALAEARIRGGLPVSSLLGVVVGMADVINLVSAILLGLAIVGRPPQGIVLLGVANRMASDLGLHPVLLLGIALVLSSIFRVIARTSVEVVLVSFHARMRETIALKIFRAFMALPYESFIQRNTAHRYTTIYTEVDRASTAVQSFLHLVVDVVALAIVFCALIVLDWRATLFATLLGTVLFIAIRPINDRVNRLGQARNEAAERAGVAIVEPLMAYRVVRTYGAGAWFERRMAQTNRTFYLINRKAATLQAVIAPSFEAGVAVILLLGLASALALPALAPDLLTAFVLLSAATYRLMPALASVSTSYTTTMFAAPGLERALADLSEAQAVQPIRPLGVPASPEIAIEFSAVDFNYRGGPLVLQSVSMTVQRGDHVGIVGPSGAGKSTMVDLILGLLQPTSGYVKLGRREGPNEPLRIGYLPQLSILRDGTVLENVAIGEESHETDRVRVRHALQRVGLEEFPLDKKLGEAGAFISGGQRQRLGIARALYAEADILLLDEPTAALDPETEHRVLESLRALDDLTWIIVTHREAPLRLCNKVYSLRDGKLTSVR